MVLVNRLKNASPRSEMKRRFVNSFSSLPSSIKPVALLKVQQVYEVAKEHDKPIIGQGGITTATDAIEFMIAGASAVGVGTALFYDPLICGKINAGITDYLSRHGMSSVNELVGTLAL